jgi:hypothetical protein
MEPPHIGFDPLQLDHPILDVRKMRPPTRIVCFTFYPVAPKIRINNYSKYIHSPIIKALMVS